MLLYRSGLCTPLARNNTFSLQIPNEYKWRFHRKTRTIRADCHCSSPILASTSPKAKVLSPSFPGVDVCQFGSSVPTQSTADRRTTTQKSAGTCEWHRKSENKGETCWRVIGVVKIRYILLSVISLPGRMRDESLPEISVKLTLQIS